VSRRDMGSFVLNLLGVYAIIQSLPLLQHFGSMLGMMGGNAEYGAGSFWLWVGFTAPFIINICAGVLLLLFADRISRAMFPESLEATKDIRADDIQSIGFSVVAVLVFLLAVPNIFQLFSNIALIMASEPIQLPKESMSIIVRNTWLMVLTVLVQCGLATALFFRSRGLANLWRRIQAGRYARIDNGE